MPTLSHYNHGSTMPTLSHYQGSTMPTLSHFDQGQYNHSAQIIEQMIQSLSQDHAKDIHKMTEKREPNK